MVKYVCFSYSRLGKTLSHNFYSAKAIHALDFLEHVARFLPFDI